jgi:transcriptional regulator with XRE-family HTH domain
MTPSPKKPDPIDVHVGMRIRLMRTAQRMSQEKLAEHCGITFQQVQKYEKGTNRIGSSRLVQISKALGQPVSAFFEGLGDAEDAAAPDPAATLFSTAEGVRLARAFAALPTSARLRADLIRHVETIAGAFAAAGGEVVENTPVYPTPWPIAELMQQPH